MIEIHRPGDGELCGFVSEHDGRWSALAVFGGVLGEHASRAEAERQVVADGLRSLAERWTLLDPRTGEEQGVLIQEAGPSGVTVALGYYSLAGTPSHRVTRHDLETGRWRLHRS